VGRPADLSRRRSGRQAGPHGLGWASPLARTPGDTGSIRVSRHGIRTTGHRDAVPQFVLRTLRAADYALDYEAVMATQETLRLTSGGEWPRPDSTPEENHSRSEGA
jgi:hypothetical protein